MDQLAAMRAFVRVVETGNFTRAAEALDTPKPTITKLVQSLEAHVRTKLLNRTTRRVTVTPDGAAYYERVVRLIADVDELDASMTVSQASLQGRLRVDVGTSAASLIILPALPDFHARYPEIQIDLGVSDRVANLIAEGVDCVVRAGTITDQSLVARRIAEIHMMTCAAPSYLARHGEPLHPLDLEKDHYMVGFMHPRTGRVETYDFSAHGEQHEIRSRYVVAVNEGNAFMAATLAGLGIAQVPVFMAWPYLVDGRLKPVLTDWTIGLYPLHVVYPPNRHLSNKLRVFVDWIADLFARDTLLKRRGAPER
ncbi:MAG: LysR family transcriptional regulator [Rhizobiales bacterium]|nr:LysR family transcriptional regulator [Hyphomicrobiales bacterium]